MKSGNWKRLLALLLVFVMCFSMLPVSAFAEDGVDGEPVPEEQEEYIPETEVTPHQHEYVPTVTEPTCEEGGYTTWTCSCGDSYVDTYTDPVGHSWVSVDAVAPTCTAAGREAGVACSVCGAVQEGCEEIPAAGHTPEAVEAVASTCTNCGHEAGTVCAVCGEVLEGCEALPLAEHTPTDVEEIPAEVGKPGTAAGVVCAVCGAVLEGCAEIPALEEVEDNDIDGVTANSEVVASGYCGDPDENDGHNLTWTLDDQCVLTISGTGAMENYNFNTMPWYSNRSSIKSVVIENGVTTIGNIAFNSCFNLTKVTIPNSVTSIGSYAFYYCSSLTSVTFPNSVTSIGDHAFAGCSSLTSMTFPNSVTSIGGYAFQGCSGLTSAGPIGSGCDYQFGWTTEIPGCAFSYCENLASVTIPESVTSIGYAAFSNCSSLTSVTIPESVTSIGDRAFNNCTSLTGVYISDLSAWVGISFENENANPLSCAHNLYCDGMLVQELVIPEGVTRIGKYAFYNCTGLTSVTIPAGVIFEGEKAFGLCNLRSAGPIGSGCDYQFGWTTQIPKYAFSYCENLASVTIPESVTSIGYAAFDHCLALTDITFPSSLIEIGSRAFQRCDGLTSVAFPENVVSDWHLRIDEYAFRDCRNLASVTIPPKVSIQRCAFLGCGALTTIHFCVSSSDSLGIGEYAFKIEPDPGAPVTTTVIVPDVNDINRKISSHDWYGDKRRVRYSDEVSGNCGASAAWSLKHGVLTVSGSGDMDDYSEEQPTPWSAFRNEIKTVIVSRDITHVGTVAFASCPALTEIRFEQLQDDTLSIGASAFFSESQLATQIVLPNPQKGNQAIMTYDWISDNRNVSYAHPSEGNCGADATWELDAEGILHIYGSGAMDDYLAGGAPWAGFTAEIKAISISGQITKIGNHAFQDCVNVETVTLPEAGLESIGNYAFYNCKKLGYLVTSAAEIGEFCFAYCSSMTSALLQEGTAYIGTYAFAYCSKLCSAALPLSIRTIRQNVFYDCTVLKTVVYPGSESDWDLVDVYNGNEVLVNALRYNTTTSNMAGDNIIWEIEDGVLRLKGTGVMNEFSDGVPWASRKNEITAIEVGNGITSVGNWAFYGLNGVQRVSLPASLTFIGDYAFWECSSLSSVLIPDKVRSVGTYCFAYCTGLRSVRLPASLRTIDRAAFFDCELLSGVSLPSGLETMGINAFALCSSLTSISIPASLHYIDVGAFSGCTALNEVRFPATLHMIHESAFENCGALSVVYYAGKAEEWAVLLTMMGENNDCLRNAVLNPGANNSIKITYNNTGGAYNPNPVTVPKGKTIELQDAYKAGYIFEGWYKEKSFKTKISSVTAEKNIPLFAKFTAMTYTIHFDGNGNTGGSMADIPVQCGKDVTLKNCGFQRTGYSFIGWTLVPEYAEEDESVIANKSKVNFDIDVGTLTLYAQWKLNTYTITYQNVGFSDYNPNTKTTFTVQDGSMALLPASRPGCTFEGWYRDGKTRTDRLDFATESKNITLKAKWSGTANTYRIVFDKNEEAGVTDVIGTTSPHNKCALNKAYNLNACKFTRAGYRFTGWNTKKDGSGTAYTDKQKGVYFQPEYAPGESTADVILYAQWEVITYTITYHNDGGPEYNTQNPVTYTAEDTFTLKAPDASHFGGLCTFEGWYREYTVKGGYKNPVTTIPKKTTGNLNLYAKWVQQENGFSIEFDGYGNTGKETVKAMTNLNYGTEYTLNDNKFKKTGYTFMGWALTPGADTPVLGNKEKVSYTVLNSLSGQTGPTFTLYAVWKPNYTITFSGNGMTGNTKTAAMEKKDRLQEIALTGNNFKWSGYTFVGWSMNPEAKEPMLTDKQKVTYALLNGLSGNTNAAEFILYAVWKANCKINFDANGGSGTMASQNASYNKEITLPKNKFTRSGYMFVGWSEDPDAWEARWPGGAKVKNINNGEKTEMTLYAVWRPVAGYISTEGLAVIPTSVITWNAERYIAALDTDGDGKLHYEWSWDSKKTKGPLMTNAEAAQSDSSKYLETLTTNHNKNNSNGFAGCKTCRGFANYMVYLTTGYNPGNILAKCAKGGTYTYTVESDFAFLPGDYICLRGSKDGSHSIFVYKVVGEIVYYIDCNSDSKSGSDYGAGIKTDYYSRSTLIGKVNESGKDWVWRYNNVVDG